MQSKNVRYCFALDLVDDPEKIKAYERWHQEVWPEILESITAAGVMHLEIYRVFNRLFMIMETNEHFSFDEKARMDAENPKVQEWETLMWNFQQPIPGAAPGEKWVLMTKIFELHSN